jgi:oligoendopeptidase F
VEKAFTSRWIDVYETQNKRSGAYSWGSYGSHPYMLLNFNGTFDAVSTVAHEMGHSMHSYFTFTNQPPIYWHYATFVAEVASTTNEILMQEYWLERAATRDEKLFLLDAFIDSIRQTVFRQTMFAEFELDLHEAAERGEALTPEMMAEISNKLWRKYYGPSLVIDDEAAVYFLRIPHFFRDFYVYQYSTSYCAATALAKKILAKEPGELDAYLGFLKSGDSDYPINILKKAGVDMTTPRPIEDCMARFKTLLDRFEATYNEKP